MAITTKCKIKAKQIENISNDFDLNVEIARLWKMTEKNIKVTPVGIGELVSIPLKFKKYVDQLGEKCTLRMLQKSTLLGTASIP